MFEREFEECAWMRHPPKVIEKQENDSIRLLQAQISMKDKHTHTHTHKQPEHDMKVHKAKGTTANAQTCPHCTDMRP